MLFFLGHFQMHAMNGTMQTESSMQDSMMEQSVMLTPELCEALRELSKVCYNGEAGFALEELYGAVLSGEMLVPAPLALVGVIDALLLTYKHAEEFPDLMKALNVELVLDDCQNNLVEMLFPAQRCGCSKPKPKQKPKTSKKSSSESACMTEDNCGCSKPRPKKTVEQGMSCMEPACMTEGECGCSKPRPKKTVAQDCGNGSMCMAEENCGCSKPRPKKTAEPEMSCMTEDNCGCSKPRPKK